MRKHLFASLFAGILIVAPLVGFAQAVPSRPANLPTNITSVAAFISVTAVRFLSMIFWALTGVFLLWAAYLYLFGADNEDNIAKAKQIFIYSIIAAVVAFFSTIGLAPLVGSLF